MYKAKGQNPQGDLYGDVVRLVGLVSKELTFAGRRLLGAECHVCYVGEYVVL